MVTENKNQTIFRFNDDGITTSVTNADITGDRIEVKLEPQWLTGNLQVSLVENTGAELQLFNAAKSGGTHTFGFNINSLLDGKTYHKIKASWQLNNVTVNHQREHKFKVLGNYRHSQYNTPSQSSSDCKVGALQPIYITTGGQYGSQCFAENAIYYEDNFNYLFKFQVDLNGSGDTILYGQVQIDAYCPNTNGSPIDANQSTYRQVNSLRPSCTGQTLSDNTVAFRKGHLDIKCGDSIFIQGQGLKVATDYCAVCGNQQLDNYTSTDGRCSNIPDLSSSAKTIKLIR